jgi:hypothetical protein
MTMGIASPRDEKYGSRMRHREEGSARRALMRLISGLKAASGNFQDRRVSFVAPSVAVQDLFQNPDRVDYIDI